ncbi:hypothetical protein [Massilia yuzhufengensis]|uniref:Terminase small subunit n=1 Tax=Massilia yuzhufengensis TaxID=1164594 RepID=A0A1I1VL64_9BURK|nr:hypothetical protein [Massilia yuzhufengensis]SFD83746.1 hypothetical protein SAMN05216204_14030 [Massilia yuzhufengensis]
MPNLTTIADWAKLVGISRQSGYAAVERCGIPVTDGKVDAEYATHLYQKNTRQRANGNRSDPLANGAQPGPSAGAGGTGGPESPAKVPGYDSSRARREAAEATLAELKLAEQAGQFLVKSEVDAAVFEAARALRDGLVNCARRIAADVAALGTADECEAVIEREHRLLLESLAHGFSEKLGAQVEGALE